MPSGTSGTSGVNGTSGTSGVNGATGPAGVNGATGATGAGGLTPVGLTGNYTLGVSDASKFFVADSTYNLTVTVPTDAVANLPVGSSLYVARNGVSSVLFAPAATVTLNSADNYRVLRTNYSVANLVKSSANTWYLSGDLTGGGATGATASSFDPNAQAFLTAAGITDPTIETAINDLVLDLKAASLWTKFYAIYPFVGGTSTTCKYNLVNPADTNAAYRLSFSGGWTFGASGARGNASNTYANTYFIPNTNYTDTTRWSQGVYTLDNSSQVSTYVNFPMAARSQTATELIQWTNDLGSGSGIGLFDPGSESARVGTFTAVNSQGLNWVDNESSTNHRIYKNSTLSASGNSSANVTPLPTVSMYIGARNNSGSGVEYQSGNTFAFAFIANVIGSSNASTLYTIIQDFQTTLGRQV